MLDIRKTDYISIISKVMESLVSKIRFLPEGNILAYLVDRGYVYVITQEDGELYARIKTMATDGGRILMNKDFIDENIHAKEGVKFISSAILHEILHIVFGHTKIYNFNYKVLANISADIEVNNYIIRTYNPPPKFINESFNHKTIFKALKEIVENTKQIPEDIRKSTIRRIQLYETRYKHIFEHGSVPEMYGAILSMLSPILEYMKKKGGETGTGKGESKSPVEIPSTIIVTDDVLPPEEVDEKTGRKIDRETIKKIREKINEIKNKISRMYEKYAGLGITDTDIILKINEPKIDWREILRDVITGRGEEVLGVWYKINRRLPYIAPGTLRLSPPRVIAIIDVSGSVLGEDLSYFITELSEIVRDNDGNIHAIFFADGVIGELSGQSISPEELQQYVKTLPSGGTRIGEAIDKALEIVEPDDIVIVFTDGGIFDVYDDDIQRKIRDLGTSCYAPVYLTTAYTPEPFKNWIVIKYYEYLLR